MEHPRRHLRFRVRFPVALESPAKRGRVGVVRDVSAGGVLLGTPSRFSAGQRVRLRFRSRVDGPETEVVGTVVRSEPNPDGDWLTRLIAIRFDREVNDARVAELERTYSMFR